MLNGIHLVDFGNHRNTRLTFGRMTALVGQNGSGKTTVMRAVSQISLGVGVAEPRIDNGFRRRGADETKVTASWPRFTKSMNFDWALKLSRNSYWYIRRRLDSEADGWLPAPYGEVDHLRPISLSRYHSGQAGPRFSAMEPGETTCFDQSSLQWNARYFKTSASSLQDAAIANPKITELNSDGSNLAWALASLMTEEPSRFQQIVEALREVVPVVENIRSRAVPLTRTVKRIYTIDQQDRAIDEQQEVNGQELIFDMKSGKGLSAEAVSEGTLVTLAILTLVYGTDANLIMLDDVELGLHPKAQRDLVKQLKRIQETHQDLQILVSTHSPYIVDEFAAEDVWLFAPDEEGCSVAKKLSDHPDAKRALEVLTTGEFWSAEGERWVLGEEETARIAEDPGA